MAKYNLQTLKGQYARERDRVGRMIRRMRGEAFDYSLADILGDIPEQLTVEDIEDLKQIKNKKDLIAYMQGELGTNNLDIEQPKPPRIDIDVPVGSVEKVSMNDIKWQSLQQNIVRPQLERTSLGSFFNEVTQYYSTADIINAVERTELENYEMQEFDYYDEKERQEVATALKVMLSELPDHPRKEYLSNLLDIAIQEMDEYVDSANRRAKRRMKNTWYNA